MRRYVRMLHTISSLWYSRYMRVLPRLMGKCVIGDFYAFTVDANAVKI